MRPQFALTFAGALAVGAGACSDHDHDDDDGTSYNCAAETTDDEFVVGLAKVGESQRYEFKLMAADPAPPSRGDNAWTLQLSTMAAPATPVAGATLTVTPFMPAHEHGSGKTVEVTPLTEAGQYRLSPVNLWMPGVWETTIRVTGAEPDRAVFRFCIPS